MKLAMILMLLTTGAMADTDYLDISVVKGESSEDYNTKNRYNYGNGDFNALKVKGIFSIQKEASLILGVEKMISDNDSLIFKTKNDKNVNYKNSDYKHTSFEVGIRLHF
jgi:hypothetical protein